MAAGPGPPPAEVEEAAAAAAAVGPLAGGLWDMLRLR